MSAAMDIVGDPLAEIPAPFHATVQPLMEQCAAFGRKEAERLIAEVPMPWPAETAENAVNAMFAELVETLTRTDPTTPEIILDAACRQCFIAFSDRIDDFVQAGGLLHTAGTMQ